MDKLECIQQATSYETTTGIDLSELTTLEERFKLPELESWVERLLQKYQKLKTRKKMNIVVVFVSGTSDIPFALKDADLC